MTNEKLKTAGLTSAEARKLQDKYGKNELVPRKKESFLKKAFGIICEPMFLLLIVAAIIYFFLGEPRDGAVMLVFVCAMIAIDVAQEWKTDKTLNALKDLSAPHVTVIRDGTEQTIPSSDLVPGDVMFVFEGLKIPADGKVLKCNDLCVDESSLTGEAEGVWKIPFGEGTENGDYWKKDRCYAGTLVTQGTAYVLVDLIGASTEYGKIGAGIASAEECKTPLQMQTGRLVKTCAGIAAVLFALVGVFTYLNIPDHIFKDRIIESILSGVTLSMAMIPEEFPVILTVFLSMGAWRLAKKNSLVRKLPSVETLGAVSVLCVDKTGTITMNQMSVDSVWTEKDETELLTVMGMACETDVYDPMEKAMLSYCESKGIASDVLFSGELVGEYAFTNALKMMGHVWRKNGEITVAAKGSAEKILTVCDLSAEEKAAAEAKIGELSAEGLRVIAVGRQSLASAEEIPAEITDCRFEFLGLVGLSDPPREGIKEDIAECKKAGIRVVMITGDNGITASAIAKKIGMDDYDHIITGDMLDKMSDEELRARVEETSIFSRVIPEHKMRIVKAFKENGEIVAMTGDGVNDAPALKYADIGIAMGKRGSEVAREASDLILMDDNFSTIVETVRDGRRIYDNIRKSVGYVFTIHIPIALASILSPMLKIAPAALFLLPLQVVILELIIDPTCSIVLERQPAERDIMDRKPRNPGESILNSKTFIKSILQGLAIFAASFGTYFCVLGGNEANASLARAMGLTVIILANLLLVQVNSSESDFAFQSVLRLMKDKVMWGVNIATLCGVFAILYTPLSGLLKLAPLSPRQLLITVLTAAVSVLWYEPVKAFKKIKKKH